MTDTGNSMMVLSNPTVCVLDSNTVIALWHFADPNLQPLHESIVNGRLSLLTSIQALDELAVVLSRPVFGLSVEAQANLLAEYRQRCRVIEQVEIQEGLPKCKDRDDQKFLNLAWQEKAGLLLTRDKALLKLAKRKQWGGQLNIQSPEIFVKNIRQSA